MSEIHKILQYPSVTIYDYNCNGYRPDAKIKTEIHNCYNLVLPYFGFYYYRSNKDYITADLSKLMLGNKGATYQILHDKKIKDKCYCINIGDNIINDLIENLLKENISANKFINKHNEFIFLHESVNASYSIKELIKSLLVQKNELGCELYTTATIYQLLINILRQSETIPDFKNNTSRIFKTRSEEIVNDSIKIISDNLNKEITLNFLADRVNCSPFHFTRIFKNHTGKSPYDFLIQKRIEYSKMLLRDTSKSITEICFECGFNNLSNFTNTFRKRNNNFSPSAYRKNL